MSGGKYPSTELLRPVVLAYCPPGDHIVFPVDEELVLLRRETVL